LSNFQSVVFRNIARKIEKREKNAKWQPELNTHELNTDNGFYHFARRNVELKQSKYWSPPSLKEEKTHTDPVSAESVSADAYFKQTTGDTSFVGTPYWFRLKNRRDFYTYDDFLSVLLAEAYWESLLVKTLEHPREPLVKRNGWSKWTRLSLAKKDSASSPKLTTEELNRAKKNQQVYLVSSAEDPQLAGLKRPFRQRFFAAFRALTGDFNGEQLLQDLVQERLNEFKVGLKLWLNPSLLTKAVGQAVPNTQEALKAFFPGGKLTRNGFLPRSLDFLSLGGVYHFQFPLPYNLNGLLQLHPNIRRYLQERHHLDLSNYGSVFHTHASWQPLNERRVGAAGTSYAVDKLYGSQTEAKNQVTYPGLESADRVNSVNAILFSLWSYFLRRRYFQVKPTAQGASHVVSPSGIPLYRRRDDVPFGALKLKLFKKRTWKQLHPADADASKIWALRPRAKNLELSEDLFSSSAALETYFNNIDRPIPGFAQTIVKA